MTRSWRPVVLAPGEGELLGAVTTGERSAALAVGATRGAGQRVPLAVELRGGPESEFVHGAVTAVVDSVPADVLLVLVEGGVAVVDTGPRRGGAGCLGVSAIPSLNVARWPAGAARAEQQSAAVHTAQGPPC